MSQSDSAYMGQNFDNMTQFFSHFDSEKILSVVCRYLEIVNPVSKRVCCTTSRITLPKFGVDNSS